MNTTTGAGPSTNRQGNFQQTPGVTNRGQKGQRPGAYGGNNSRPSVFGNITPRGSNERTISNGSAVRMRPNGRVSDVHDAQRGIDVHHGLNGNRAIFVDRPDHSRIFAERGRPGFVQRPYSFHGHDFAQRTYFYHGHAYNRFYRGFGFRGLFLNVYAPGYYYRPAFYGWAYNPWDRPIFYDWGWRGSPWYSYYGGYFQPYPTYPSAAYWLTDYMISTDLQEDYAAHAEAGEMDGAPLPAVGAPELTPDVKQQISDEVRNQLALENQEAQQNAQQQDMDPGSSGIARMLSDGRSHVFVAGAALDLVDANGQECGISDGDVLGLQNPPPPDATAANLVVLASKGGGECPKYDTVAISLGDLQEMQNHMRASIDQGLQDLQAKQGRGGLPPLPPAAQSQPSPAAFEAAAPPPDPNAGAEIQQQTQQADQAESDVTAAAGQDGNNAAAPATVTLGQTQADVESILGQPTSRAFLGMKVIYNYNGMKVIFKDGRVIDVQ